MKFVIEGTRTQNTEHEIQDATLQEAVDLFKEIEPGFRIVAINGREVHGFCEGCDLPYFEEDETVSDPEGVALHRRCVPEEMLEKACNTCEWAMSDCVCKNEGGEQ